MADGVTTGLGIRKPEVGVKTAWGGDDGLNEVIDAFDEAVSGVTTKSLNGNATLTSTQFEENEVRDAVLVFTDGGLSSSPTITVPAKRNNWHVKNSTPYDIIMSAGGTTATVRTGKLSWVYCDGTDCFVDDPTLDTIKAPASSVSMNSQKLTGLANGTADGDAVNKGQLDALVSDANVATVAAISSDVTTVADNIDDIVLVADRVDGSIATVSTNISDINNVSNNILVINSVDDNEANIAAVGQNIGSINTVTGQISKVVTCADNIADIQNASVIVTGVLNNSALTGTPTAPTATTGTDTTQVATTEFVQQVKDTIPKGLTTIERITTSQTWTCPAGVTKVRVKMVGGGGGGGMSDRSFGASGDYIEFIQDVVPDTDYTLVIGSGGVADGASGGDTECFGRTAGGGASGINAANPSGRSTFGVSDIFLFGQGGTYMPPSYGYAARGGANPFGCGETYGQLYKGWGGGGSATGGAGVIYIEY